MSYRQGHTTAAGEVLRGLVIFVALEAFVFWASTIAPQGELLFQLLALALLVFIIPIGMLIVTIGAVQRARAAARYHRLSLGELQRTAPAMPVGPPSMRAVTIYGNQLETWFEALFDRTLEEAPGSPEARAILTRQYVSLLAGLESYVRARWPEKPPADENGQIALGGPAIETSPLYRTFRWLGEVAADQAARSDASPDHAGLRWDPLMFDAVEINNAVRTACTPARLRSEIERLSNA